MAEFSNKVVIFDLDGVLINTAEYHKVAWRELAERNGFEISDDFFYSTFGMQNYQIIPTMAKRELSDSEFQEMSDWKENRYRELIAGKLELLAGAERLIKDLKNSGFALAIGSSTPRSNLEFMLKNLPIEKYFDAMVVGEDVKNGKPAPDTFLKAAEKLDIAPEYCVVVEDAVQGLKAAKNAGMAVVAVTTTRSRDDLTIADMIVDSLEELSARDFERLLDRI